MSANATLITESKNAECVVKALSVDNKEAEITSTVNGNLIQTEITSKNSRTLLSTLDDLLRCQMIAEKIIEDG